MWNASYFAPRYFNAEYWAKVGADVTFNPAWAVNSNRVVGWGLAPS